MVRHALIRQTGVPDKLTYTNDLYQLYQQLQAGGRNTVIQDDGLSEPAPEEVARIRRRGSYRSPEELIIDLSGNLPSCANVELQKCIQYSFAFSMWQEALV